MASVYKRGSKYWIMFRNEGRLYREPVGVAKRDAERALLKRLTEIVDGKFYPDKRKPCKKTFSDFAPDFLKWSKEHKRSWARDARSLAMLSMHFGAKRLDWITPAEIETYKTLRTSGVIKRGPRTAKGPTVNRELRCLTKLLNVAVELGILNSHALGRGKVRLFPENQGRVVMLEAEQIKKLIENCSVRLRPLVELLVYSGMRYSEATLLRWPEVDLQQGVINLAAERCKGKRARTVPLSSEAIRVLKVAKVGRHDKTDLVFHGPKGEPIKSIRSAWRVATKNTGLPTLRLHDLRHVAASSMASRGVSLQIIGSILGHSTPSQTLIYAHLLPSAVRGAIEQVVQFVAGKNLAVMPSEAVSEAKTDHKNDHSPEQRSQNHSTLQVVATVNQGT